MNKQELIDAVAGSRGESKAATGETTDAILDVVTLAVTDGDTLQLIGFGSFPFGRAQHGLAAIQPPVPKKADSGREDG